MDSATTPAILIVDDAPENIEILGNTLQEYRKYIALNGEKALKLAVEKNPNLILLDVMMPGISGYDVIKRLKSDDRTREIPVIFITALSDAHDEAHGFELGAADYITKPFKPDIVRARVKTQLLIKEQQDALHKLNQSLLEKNSIILAERERAGSLLANILPASVIQDLEEYGKTEPKYYEEATIMFVDIVGFSKLAAQLHPATLINELNEIFTAFDEIVATYGCERIKTIGDGYMAVCGVPLPDKKHAQLILSAAIDFLSYITHRNNNLPEARHRFDIRIGINSGPVIGGVVGSRKYIYDIFGDAVNVASRMEAVSEPMRVAVSERTNALTNADYRFVNHGTVSIKGIGNMIVYFLDDRYSSIA